MKNTLQSYVMYFIRASFFIEFYFFADVLTFIVVLKFSGVAIYFFTSWD